MSHFNSCAELLLENPLFCISITWDPDNNPNRCILLQSCMCILHWWLRQKWESPNYITQTPLFTFPDEEHLTRQETHFVQMILFIDSRRKRRRRPFQPRAPVSHGLNSLLNRVFTLTLCTKLKNKQKDPTPDILYVCMPGYRKLLVHTVTEQEGKRSMETLCWGRVRDCTKVI